MARIASIIHNNILRTSQADTESWEHIGSKTCSTPCHLPSSADNSVTMELATPQEENPCVNRGSGVVCPPPDRTLRGFRTKYTPEFNSFGLSVSTEQNRLNEFVGVPVLVGLGNLPGANQQMALHADFVRLLPHFDSVDRMVNSVSSIL